MYKKLASPIWAFLTLILLVALFVSQTNFLESVKLRYFDTLITSKAPTENNIYTVNIDEAALEKWGQWPFPRTAYAELVEDLYARGAGLVIFNVMMPEADRFGGDAALADVLSQYPIILPNTVGESTKNSPKNPGAAIIGSEYIGVIPQYPGIIANILQLEENAVGVGIVSTMPEIDGVNRRLPLIVSVDGNLYPSLSLEALRVIAGDPNFQVKLNEFGVEKMRIPQFGPVTTDSEGRVWIDWSQTNRTVSAVDLPQDFQGAVVIVGVSAAGIANPVPTAKGPVFTQDMQAALIGTMFNGSNIQRPDWMPGAEIGFILLVGSLIILLSRWTYVGLATTTVGIVAPIIGSYWGYAKWGILADPTASTIAFVLVSLHVYGVKFVREFLEKQAIKKQFEGYASPTVVKLLQENPDIIKKGIKKEVSILFSDLRGFTPLGESFGDDVAGLTKIMNGYMDAITQPVLNNNGMIIKYIGDASMHIHNAPLDDPKHHATAVRTGLEMLKAVEKFNHEVVIPQGRPPVGMGAGINSGWGYIGEMGSTKRHSYDVLGDAVSTAARVESKCKEYGCLLLVGGATVQHCENEFFFLKIDDLAVKGKSVGIPIYTVLDDVKAPWKQAKKQHDKMHDLYRAQKFDEAIEICKLLHNHFDGKMSKYYDMWIERCEFQKTQDLPKDWNGVFIATTK
jgi:adenylate cyclase